MFLLEALFTPIRQLNDLKLYFRDITINDLNMLLDDLLDRSTYHAQESSKAFVPLDLAKDYSIVFAILSTAFKNSIKESANKTLSAVDFRTFLEPIKNWSLIPVKRNKKRFLAPVCRAKSILVRSSASFMFDILERIGFPVLDEYQNNSRVFETAVVKLSNNEELLRFLDHHKNKYEEIFQDARTRTELLGDLAQLVYSDHKGGVKFNFGSANHDVSMSATEARRILKQLPIYKDAITDAFHALLPDSTRAYYIDLNKVPYAIKSTVFERRSCSDEKADFIDFINKQDNLIIMGLGSKEVTWLLF